MRFVNLIPAILIILTIHIIIAVHRMLMKILSVVINDQWSRKVIVPARYYLVANILRIID